MWPKSHGAWCDTDPKTLPADIDSFTCPFSRITVSLTHWRTVVTAALGAGLSSISKRHVFFIKLLGPAARIELLSLTTSYLFPLSIVFVVVAVGQERAKAASFEEAKACSKGNPEVSDIGFLK